MEKYTKVFLLNLPAEKIYFRNALFDVRNCVLELNLPPLPLLRISDLFVISISLCSWAVCACVHEVVPPVQFVHVAYQVILCLYS
jgi:hypothetical protein